MIYTLENSITTESDDRRSAVKVEEERIQELRDKCPNPFGKSLWECMEYKTKIGRADAMQMEEVFVDAFELGYLLMEAFDPTYLELLDVPCTVSNGQAVFENVGAKTITIFYKWVGNDLRIIDIDVKYIGDPIKGLSQDEILEALRP